MKALGRFANEVPAGHPFRQSEMGKDDIDKSHIQKRPETPVGARAFHDPAKNPFGVRVRITVASGAPAGALMRSVTTCH